MHVLCSMKSRQACGKRGMVRRDDFTQYAESLRGDMGDALMGGRSGPATGIDR